MIKFIMFAAVMNIIVIGLAKANALELNGPAPLFKATLHDGSAFDLETRRAKGWTVLYFYPKADTPGCTKQACAFRDSIEVIRQLGAEVYGVSADSVEAQRKFHEKYNLSFALIADASGAIIEMYGAKKPLLKMANRWTFLIDPELTIRWIEKDVDPVLDAQRVATKIQELQKK